MTRQVAQPMTAGSTGPSGTGMVTAEDMRLYEQKFGKPQEAAARTESYNVSRSARRGGANQDRRDARRDAPPVNKAAPWRKEVVPTAAQNDAKFNSELQRAMEDYIKRNGGKRLESGQSQRNRMSNDWANSQLYRG